jgi:hypothetical protein
LYSCQGNTEQSSCDSPSIRSFCREQLIRPVHAHAADGPLSIPPRCHRPDVFLHVLTHAPVYAVSCLQILCQCL